MIGTITSVVITFIISGLLGYITGMIKNENVQNKALLTLLKTNLTNVFFIYNDKKQIPDYVYQNFNDELAVYELLGGNGYIHTMAKKMENWDIIKTDILK